MRKVTVKGGTEEVETLGLYIFARCFRVEIEGTNFETKLNSHDRFPHQTQMIPSFTSFPSQPQQPDSEVSASSHKHKPSKKEKKRKSARTRDNDEQEKRRRRHGHTHNERDRDRDLKGENHLEASPSSTTFFSDYKGNRAAAHGGGTDSIRVPKYNLVARTFLQNITKCN